jgi:hypothetical protein
MRELESGQASLLNVELLVFSVDSVLFFPHTFVFFKFKSFILLLLGFAVSFFLGLASFLFFFDLTQTSFFVNTKPVGTICILEMDSLDSVFFINSESLESQLLFEFGSFNPLLLLDSESFKSLFFLFFKQ